MNDARFFSMKQFWQSLALTVVIGGGAIAAVTYGVFGAPEQPAAASATATDATSTTPAAATLSASAVTALPGDPLKSIQISGRAAIIVDLSSGQTLYSQNADSSLPLASLTKLLTMYEAQSVLSPTSVITISSTSLAQDGDYGLTEGEQFSYADLARFALVASSNDAAEAIAEAAGAVRNENEQQLMQEAVQSAGLLHTQAANGTGLDIDTTEAGAYGSARDVAKLAALFLKTAPSLSAATTRTAVSITSLTGTPHSLSNTNPDVKNMSGLLLSKTGYTDLAGGNLAVVFDAGINHRIAIVVLGSTRDGRFTDVEKLMQATRLSLQQTPNP